jgi:hypothetical protein
VKAHAGETSSPGFAKPRVGLRKKNRSVLLHGVLGESKERWSEATLESLLAHAPDDRGKERITAALQLPER